MLTDPPDEAHPPDEIVVHRIVDDGDPKTYAAAVVRGALIKLDAIPCPKDDATKWTGFVGRVVPARWWPPSQSPRWVVREDNGTIPEVESASTPFVSPPPTWDGKDPIELQADLLREEFSTTPDADKEAVLQKWFGIDIKQGHGRVPAGLAAESIAKSDGSVARTTFNKPLDVSLQRIPVWGDPKWKPTFTQNPDGSVMVTLTMESDPTSTRKYRVSFGEDIQRTAQSDLWIAPRVEPISKGKDSPPSFELTIDAPDLPKDAEDKDWNAPVVRGYALYVRRTPPVGVASEWRCPHIHENTAVGDSHSRRLVPSPVPTREKQKPGNSGRASDKFGAPTREFAMVYDHLTPFGAADFWSQMRKDPDVAHPTPPAKLTWRLVDGYKYDFAVRFIRTLDEVDPTVEPPKYTTTTHAYTVPAGGPTVTPAPGAVTSVAAVEPVYPKLARNDEKTSFDGAIVEPGAELEVEAAPPMLTYEGLARVTVDSTPLRRIMMAGLFEADGPVFPDPRAGSLWLRIELLRDPFVLTTPGSPSLERVRLKLGDDNPIEELRFEPFTNADGGLRRARAYVHCKHDVSKDQRQIIITVYVHTWSMRGPRDALRPGDGNPTSRTEVYTGFVEMDETTGEPRPMGLHGCVIVRVETGDVLGRKAEYFLEVPGPWTDGNFIVEHWPDDGRVPVPWEVGRLETRRQRWQWRGHPLPPGRDDSNVDFVNERLFDGYLPTRSALHATSQARLGTDGMAMVSLEDPVVLEKATALGAPGSLWRFTVVPRSRYGSLGGAFAPRDPIGDSTALRPHEVAFRPPPAPAAEHEKPRLQAPLVVDAVPEIDVVDGKHSGRVLVLLAEPAVIRAGDSIVARVRAWQDAQGGGDAVAEWERVVPATGVLGLTTSFADTEFPNIHASAVIVSTEPSAGAFLRIALKRKYDRVLPFVQSAHPEARPEHQHLESPYSTEVDVQLPPRIGAPTEQRWHYVAFVRMIGTSEQFLEFRSRTAPAQLPEPPADATHYREIYVEWFRDGQTGLEHNVVYVLFGVVSVTQRDQSPDHRVVAVSPLRAIG